MACNCDSQCDEVDELDDLGYDAGYDDGFKEAVRWCLEGLDVMSNGYADSGKALDCAVDQDTRHPYQVLAIFTSFRLEAALKLAAEQIRQKCPYDLDAEDED